MGMMRAAIRGTKSVSLNPGAKIATVTGTGVDLQGKYAAEVVFLVGTVTDGTHTPSIEESDDNSTFTAVVAAEISGSVAVLASNTVRVLGYLGSKRYIRPKSTVAGATTGAVYGAAIQAK
jgi:hypothetical protein